VPIEPVTEAPVQQQQPEPAVPEEFSADVPSLRR